jgi:hypothetical protein
MVDKRCQKEWLEYWKALDEKSRDVVTRHLKICGGIKAWDDIRDHLIEEFHHKKPDRIADRETERAYQGLFLGHQSISLWDVYPQDFLAALEDVMFAELSPPHNGAAALTVYYGHIDKPAEHKFDTVDLSTWQLEACLGMTSADWDVMRLFRREFLKFIDDMRIMVIRSPIRSKSEYRNLLNDEYKRAQKALAELW